MSFLLYITHAEPKRSNKRTKKLQSGAIISYAIASLWASLIIFGMISIANPPWLAKISTHGRDIEALTLKNYGDLFMREGKYNLAAIQYEYALKIKPDYIDAIVNLGIAFARMGLNKKAISTLKNALTKNPAKAYVIQYNLAEIYLASGDLGSAIKYYAMAAETAPFPILSYYKIGRIYLNAGDWDSAIRAFQLALNNKLDMKNSYTGMLKDNLGSYSGKPEIEKAISSALERGISESELERYDRVVFEEVLRHERGLSEIHNFIGYAYAMKENFSKAIEHYRIALDIWHGNVEAQRNLNKLLLKSN